MNRVEIPAFPVVGGIEWAGYPGMTLRDYFAAKAMQGELATQNEKSRYYKSPPAGMCGKDYIILSKKAYDIADAMLVERERVYEHKTHGKV